MLRTTTSTSLLAGLRQPENDALWTEFVGRYRPLLLRLAMRLGISEHDAEDIAQITLMEFATAYAAGRYDQTKGRLRSWLFGIAKNQILNWRRRSPAPAGEGLDAAAADAPCPAHAVDGCGWERFWDQEWRNELLRQCLREVRAEVEERTYEAFHRFAIAGRSADEVAAELGISRNAVYLAKRRILRRARELLPLMEEIW